MCWWLFFLAECWVLSLYALKGKVVSEKICLFDWYFLKIVFRWHFVCSTFWFSPLLLFLLLSFSFIDFISCKFFSSHLFLICVTYESQPAVIVRVHQNMVILVFLLVYKIPSCLHHCSCTKEMTIPILASTLSSSSVLFSSFEK